MLRVFKMMMLTMLIVAAGTTARAWGQDAPIADQPLAAYQVRLLDVAFEAASAMPVNPHIKDRSRAQEQVVAACFELDQPVRALRYIKRIDNWRRGVGFADYAFYCVRHGHEDHAQAYLDMAGQFAQAEGVEDWRRDRIRVRIAMSLAWMGRQEEAQRMEQGVDASQVGGVARAQAMQADAESFHDQLAALDAMLATGEFDRVRNGIEALVEHFGRFYDDAARRSLAEERIRQALPALPIFVQVELLMHLADSALDNADEANGLRLVNEAQSMMDGAFWDLLQGVPLKARLAALRWRAGDRQRARADLDAQCTLFDEQAESVQNFERATILRPIAEAYQSMGDTPTAMAVYRSAVEQGAVNPNLRPRAEDLAATCASMALHALEPDAELWQKIAEIHQGMVQP